MRNFVLASLGLWGLLTLPPRLGSRGADETKLWEVLMSGIDTNLRGVSADFAHPLSESGDRSVVIWAAGSNGVILRSVDEGKTWTRLHVEGGDKLDFRGIRSFGDATAFVMSIGDNGRSRIYKTTDGGKTWQLQYSDKRKEFFLDALVCRSEKDCFAISDPIDGKFLLLHTEDREHWNELPRDSLPPALAHEGIFAASNSALTICGEHELFFGTGGPAARVFHSADSGKSWTVAETPILSGNVSSGIFSLRCSGDTVVAVGGDYLNAGQPFRVAAYSLDRGATWKLADHAPEGFRSAVDVVDDRTWVAVGPTGEDISTDNGAHWKHSASRNLNAIFVLDDRTIPAVGTNGTVAEYKIQYEIRNRRSAPEWGKEGRRGNLRSALRGGPSVALLTRDEDLRLRRYTPGMQLVITYLIDSALFAPTSVRKTSATRRVVRGVLCGEKGCYREE
jgi:photosystem II stability/assembly factor-like uncharacterized protein